MDAVCSFLIWLRISMLQAWCESSLLSGPQLRPCLEEQARSWKKEDRVHRTESKTTAQRIEGRLNSLGKNHLVKWSELTWDEPIPLETTKSNIKGEASCGVTIKGVTVVTCDCERVMDLQAIQQLIFNAPGRDRDHLVTFHHLFLPNLWWLDLQQALKFCRSSLQPETSWASVQRHQFHSSLSGN